jgi:hypothetical protein
MKLNRFHKQSGASLMEVLVAMTISLVVTAAMIAMMSNTLGTTARIVQMTKLQDDLRVTMQMMTRDLRRSNYNADSMLCFANDNCGEVVDGSIVAPREVFVHDSNQCFWFVTDRESDNFASPLKAGAFRLVAIDLDGPDGDRPPVGVLQMWTGTGEPPLTICDPSVEHESWVQITDPEKVDITAFSVNDTGNGLSYTQVIRDDEYGNFLEQEVKKVRMNIQASLVLDDSISKTIEDVITVRNDLISRTPI